MKSEAATNRAHRRQQLSVRKLLAHVVGHEERLREQIAYDLVKQERHLPNAR